MRRQISLQNKKILEQMLVSLPFRCSSVSKHLYSDVASCTSIPYNIIFQLTASSDFFAVSMYPQMCVDFNTFLQNGIYLPNF
ncbi:hypothetical protein HNY73_006878 [Argiope bruennichi]|uniref:Uncharacterized protein n=1 Tax=Argiope bruennichi TaxID=94029 RepID=A0A8T0FEQ2_ARGBR|nr:hypothetical protein HNY73_006878 [Argiope bruennichi]